MRMVGSAAEPLSRATADRAARTIVARAAACARAVRAILHNTTHPPQHPTASHAVSEVAPLLPPEHRPRSRRTDTDAQAYGLVGTSEPANGQAAANTLGADDTVWSLFLWRTGRHS